MTVNEFKLICICFCKKYDGKCFGEIFEDIVLSLKYKQISSNNIRFDSINEVYFRNNGCVLFGFFKNKIQYIQHVKKNSKIAARWVDVDMALFVFDDIV